MKREDAKKLKIDDKIVVEVKEGDPWDLDDNKNVLTIYKNQVVGKLEDFQPAKEKIKMTVKEKKEFDELKECSMSLSSAFYQINEVDYPNLFYHLFDNTGDEENNKVQIDFSKAWDKPSLIEVEKEKRYLINILRTCYLHFDVENEIYWFSETRYYRSGVQDIFTQLEIDEMQKLDEFKAIDLNKCKTEVEK